MTNEQLQLMMLDIDGVLTRYEATTADVLAAAQQMAVSAIGHLVNAASKREQDDARVSESSGTGSADTSEATDQVPVPSDSLHLLADDIAEQIRAALHKRIAEGKKPDW